MSEKTHESSNGVCTLQAHPLPAGEISRYSVESDYHAERDIASYVEGQAPNEVVQHVERIKKEVVLGDTYEVWDVTTDKDRWWVITNLTNLYSQKYFPTLDYTISFHIGLMMRLRSRPDRIIGEEPSPFDEVFRRMDQATARHDAAIEAEDFQAVGMLLREALLSLNGAVRRETELPPKIERPQEANFILWIELLMNHLCSGGSNKELRQHLKNLSKEAWQLSNWLTHTKSASRTASSVAIHTCQTVVGHLMQVIKREEQDHVDQCPVCKSRDVRKHYDVGIPPEGDHYLSCGVCAWDDHPGA